MIKSLFGAILGALLIGLALPSGLMWLDWLDSDHFWKAAGGGMLLGAVIGWLRPRWFLWLGFSFLEGDWID